jgi:hypothetical protein
MAGRYAGEPLLDATIPALKVEAPPGERRARLGRAVSIGALARPRPEEGVAFAALVIEEIRVDRRVERRIVELQRQIIATFLGALRPRCPDLDIMWCTA